EVVERLLLDVGEDEHSPAVVDRPKHSCREIGPLHLAWRKRAVIIMKLVQGKAQLPQTIGAVKPVGGFAHLLHRRDQQTDQNGDDGDYHQQFHQGDTASFLCCWSMACSFSCLCPQACPITSGARS